MMGHYHLSQYIKSVENAHDTWQEMHYLYLFHRNLARVAVYKPSHNISAHSTLNAHYRFVLLSLFSSIIHHHITTAFYSLLLVVETFEGDVNHPYMQDAKLKINVHVFLHFVFVIV